MSQPAVLAREKITAAEGRNLRTSAFSGSQPHRAPLETASGAMRFHLRNHRPGCDVASYAGKKTAIEVGSPVACCDLELTWFSSKRTGSPGRGEIRALAARMALSRRVSASAPTQAPAQSRGRCGDFSGSCQIAPGE